MYFLYVGVFGALGGMCRYAMNLWFGGGDFPSATLAVNLIGCFFIGFSHAIFGGKITCFIGAFERDWDGVYWRLYDFLGF